MTFNNITSTRRTFLAGAGLVISFTLVPKVFTASALEGVQAGG
jgi:isoquinoline 1-oxidoreductase subunit beta